MDSAQAWSWSRSRSSTLMDRLEVASYRKNGARFDVETPAAARRTAVVANNRGLWEGIISE